MGWLDLWGIPIMLATIVPAFTAAIILMFARFFESKELDQAAKTELVFAGSTIFIVLALLVALPLAESIFVSVANQAYGQLFTDYKPQLDMIEISKATMYPHVECMKSLIAALYLPAIPVEATLSSYIEVFMSEVSSGFVYKAFSERIQNTVTVLSFYLYAYYILVHVLNFIKYTALSLFLPAGIILRAFPPTRGAGAYVMAFAIGFYFVFPLAYVVMNTAQLSYNTQGWCALPAAPDVAVSSCGFFDQSKPKEMESWVKRNSSYMQVLLDVFEMRIVKQLTLSICLLPLMAFVITLSFVLSSTSLFGGNIPEVGRGLVKLI